MCDGNAILFCFHFYLLILSVGNFSFSNFFNNRRAKFVRRQLRSSNRHRFAQRSTHHDARRKNRNDFNLAYWFHVGFASGDLS